MTSEFEAKNINVMIEDKVVRCRARPKGYYNYYNLFDWAITEEFKHLNIIKSILHQVDTTTVQCVFIRN